MDIKNAIRIPVLMYHRIGETRNDQERRYCVEPARFALHMHSLEQAGWRAVSLTDFFLWLDGTLEVPEKSFLLTFDGGFLGVHEHAAPVLCRMSWSSTVFLVSQLIGKCDIWSGERNSAADTHPLMNVHHIRELRSLGFSFQSHTRHHVDLPMLDDANLRLELKGAREDIEGILGEPVLHLAYPYGRHDERVLHAVREAGYQSAFSTCPGFNRRAVDRFRLRRLDVFGTDSPAALCRKIEFGGNDGSLWHSIRYRTSRVASRLGF